MTELAMPIADARSERARDATPNTTTVWTCSAAADAAVRLPRRNAVLAVIVFAAAASPGRGAKHARPEHARPEHNDAGNSAPAVTVRIETRGSRRHRCRGYELETSLHHGQAA